MDAIQDLKDKVSLLERQVDWLHKFGHTHDAIGEAVNPSRDYPIGQEKKAWCEHIHFDNGYWHFRDWNLNVCEQINYCPICRQARP